MRKNSFIYSTIVLIIANFLVRFLGFVYKILLSRYLGSEGIGLYHLVFHAFLVIVTITSSGIPVAVSKITAQKMIQNDYKGCKKTLFTSILLGLSLSLVLCILIYNNLELLIKYLIKSSKLNNSLLVLIPAIPIVTLSSIIRSYFYGIKNVMPSANAQIVEQFVRIAFVLSILYYFEPQDLRLSVMIATLGIAIGEIGGLLILLVKLRSSNLGSSQIIKKEVNPTSSPHILWKIIVISIPITLSRLVSVLMQSANMFLVPHRLQAAGFTLDQSVTTFGEVVGMTMPLLFLPFIVTSAFVVNLVPNISAENTLMRSTNIELKSILAIRVALIIAIPIAFIFFFFSTPICSFLYSKPSVGNYLRYLSVTVIFLSLHHIIAGILHGLGKQVLTTINYLIGMSLHFVCIYYLVAMPSFGINGFIIGFIFSSFLILLLNFISLRHFLTIRIKFLKHILSPIISSIFMTLIIVMGNKYCIALGLSLQLSILLPTLLGGLVYWVCIIMTGSIKIETIEYIFSMSK
ncbi:polysaccharide biosynthesis protein [Wukongibacter baidiensis]|uniref:putative polysaccharide biosynthesis protein n=1 Tax=Wukongibacter baidiensis TaxID=1723361 RepID=UPI003D7FDD1B